MTRPDPPGVCTCDALPAGHNDDQCAMEAWRRYTRAFPGPCKCSHPESMHYRDRKGRPTCGVSVCGCAEFREDTR